MEEKTYEWCIEKGVPYLTFKKFLKEPIIQGFTTRLGGVSSGYLAHLNLGFNRGDQKENVLENYRRLCDALGVPLESVVISKQVHEDHLVKVTKKDCGNGILRPNQWESMDGLYTMEEGVTLVTHYADCVPLFFYAKGYHAVGMAHAGWRGTVQEIGAKMIKVWHEEENIPLEAIEVAIGPSIGACCFEVGPEVVEAFRSRFKHNDFIIENPITGKHNIDLWAYNKASLINHGLKEEQITIANLCTSCCEQTFFSHRKTQGKRGTLCGVMALKEM